MRWKEEGCDKVLPRYQRLLLEYYEVRICDVRNECCGSNEGPQGEVVRRVYVFDGGGEVGQHDGGDEK